MRPAGLTLTVTGVAAPVAPSLDAAAGATDNQVGLPDTADTAAVHVIAPWPRLITPMVCGGLTPAPATAVKVSPVWSRRMLCLMALTVTVSGRSRSSPVDAVTARVTV